MTDFIASDKEGRWDADRAEFSGEAEPPGSWEHRADRWPGAKDDPNPPAAYRQRTTATASWQRSVLIIAALSTLTWTGVTVIVVVALSAL
jgi:hypothetical protein